jgi:hypothetical protein
MSRPTDLQRPWARVAGCLIALTMVGVAAAQPVLQVQVDDTEVEHNNLVDLGEIPVGQTVTASLTLRNTGDAQLIINPVALVGLDVEDYSTNLLSASLAPNGAVTGSVSFTPSQVGPRDSVFVLINNSNQNPMAILFTGIGTDIDDGSNNFLPTPFPCATGATGGILLAALGLTGLRAFNRKRL